jgi:hypothetical protein
MHEVAEEEEDEKASKEMEGTRYFKYSEHGIQVRIL